MRNFIVVQVAEKKNEGFQSGAGLIRYFDEEEINGPALDPKLVIYIGIMVAVMVELISHFWPIT
ncbi:MAG: preprotein translocase subunit Sec61beta [Candidatus Thermoplasmatota archaeon]|nr:preprotein translocase subunit Sec61beta [Candidatus Thermoplasmatota archaeon]MCL5731509.1 preprotein translocase subunit Sec61beta [Candidatus Thermoplasmatota archaeon]